MIQQEYVKLAAMYRLSISDSLLQVLIPLQAYLRRKEATAVPIPR